ncbi:hypothetical protein CAEBREN_05199 [Caenorhabditis brenneri]|uniref:Uncharacterized protein n=1 Tax=Caenorhabditis brenneri TaxID=135651 RepID=G0MYF3_CAEBE|nr:hypothetical protein CAEBREN_05199 [Caenorhabditis brenneri]
MRQAMVMLAAAVLFTVTAVYATNSVQRKIRELSSEDRHAIIKPTNGSASLTSAEIQVTANVTKVLIESVLSDFHHNSRTANTSSAPAVKKGHHAAGFPMREFVVTTSNNQTDFHLKNLSGVVYKVKVEYLYRELAWVDGSEIFMTVDISSPGAAVFLTKCNDYPISLKPNVLRREYQLSRECLEQTDGCIHLHVIATEGDVDGHILVVTKPVAQWRHMHLIAGVMMVIICLILLLRKCVNHIIRVVYSYTPMEECEVQVEQYA